MAKYAALLLCFNVFFLKLSLLVLAKPTPRKINAEIGNISEKLRAEIHAHSGTANDIINFVTKGKGKHQVYNRLANFTDKFGSRISGTENLENAIDYMLQEVAKDGLENVHGEEVTVPHWVRGCETAEMLLPRNHAMSILGLGGSVGTPPCGITADVLVVKSFEELKNRSKEAKGKIVVFNQDFVSYGETVAYRVFSAQHVAKAGGVASLTRSVTPFSINSPHTGMQLYEKGVQKIPTACITVEDAEMMWRMAQRGETIVVNLTMGAVDLPPVQSRNTVAEIVGEKYPEQVVLVSGHLDSWDVGQGAMDDGGGAFISWQALSIIRQLKLRPKRTLRMVLWTGEEQGLIGGIKYFNDHKINISKYDLVMESDIGTFKPLGIDFSGSPAAKLIMKEVLQLLEPIGATELGDAEVGGDITEWVKAKVPGGSLKNANEKYFYFHHSNGDTMTVQDPDFMDLCAAVWAVVAYTVADLEDMLPRYFYY